MFGKKNSDVLIVGAGPIGMVAALTLAQSGVRANIIDKAGKTCARSNALVINPASLEAFNRLGFVDRILDQSFRVEQVVIYDESQIRETIRLSDLGIAYPYLAILPQSVLEDILESELRKEGVSILWNHRATHINHMINGIELEVDRLVERSIGYAVAHSEKLVDKTLSFTTKLMLVADGYNSLLRKWLHIDTNTVGETRQFAVFEVETDSYPEKEIRISLGNGLETVQYPMVGGMSRLNFQFDGAELPSEYRNKDTIPIQTHFEQEELLGDKHLHELIEDRCPWDTGYINRVIWRTAVPFELRKANILREGHALLLGDAARSFGPTGMASVNLGIQEAEKLAYSIKDGLRQSELLTQLDRLLEDFELKWDAIYQLGDHARPFEMADTWTATNRERLLQSLPVNGVTLERLASQLFIHLVMPEMVDA